MTVTYHKTWKYISANNDDVWSIKYFLLHTKLYVGVSLCVYVCYAFGPSQFTSPCIMHATPPPMMMMAATAAAAASDTNMKGE